MRKVLKWIREHVRPYFKCCKRQRNDIDFQKDGLKDIIKKTKDEVEVGVKFTFKF